MAETVIIVWNWHSRRCKSIDIFPILTAIEASGVQPPQREHPVGVTVGVVLVGQLFGVVVMTIVIFGRDLIVLVTTTGGHFVVLGLYQTWVSIYIQYICLVSHGENSHSSLNYPWLCNCWCVAQFKEECPKQKGNIISECKILEHFWDAKIASGLDER